MVRKPSHIPWWVIGAVTTVIGAVIITTTTAYSLYHHTVNLLTDNLRERLLAIVTTAVVQIDADDIVALQVEEDWQRPEWARVVNQLAAIKNNNEDIIFVYIFRKTAADPSLMEFVSDAGSLNPYANVDDDPTNDVDVDGNGVIDGVDELQWPGQPYPEPPEETFEAYDGPLTNRELYEDQWGRVITGYAPIRNDAGETVAVLAVDIRADDFFTITQQTLYPFTLFIAALIIILLLLSGILIFIWSKRMKLVQEIDRQKDELLGIVSHQLATPISSINWYVSALKDGDVGKLTKEQKDHVDLIGNITTELGILVSTILDVSRIELGRMPVARENVHVQVVVDEILALIQRAAHEKDVSIKYKKAKDSTLYIDKHLLHLILLNLMTNAIKYSKDGGTVVLEIGIKKSMLEIRVQDSGCGIPKDQQEKIFQKLFRARNVETIGGNGFGLYSVKGAAESMGGKVWFESVEGKGSTFFVSIPAKKKDGR